MSEICTSIYRYCYYHRHQSPSPAGPTRIMECGSGVEESPKERDRQDDDNDVARSESAELPRSSVQYRTVPSM